MACVGVDLDEVLWQEGSQFQDTDLTINMYSPQYDLILCLGV